MSDLKLCPFCGGEAKTEQVERIHYGTVYRIGCNTDGCRGWWYESVLYRTEAKAIEAWNTRSEQAIAATLGTPEIVRCRDCRYYSEYQDLCERLQPGMLVMEADGFCAWGELRCDAE